MKVKCPKCNGNKIVSHTSKLRHFGMPEFMPGGRYEIPENATIAICGPCMVCEGTGEVYKDEVDIKYE